MEVWPTAHWFFTGIMFGLWVITTLKVVNQERHLKYLTSVVVSQTSVINWLRSHIVGEIVVEDIDLTKYRNKPEDT